MNSREADALGLRLANLLSEGKTRGAYAALSPLLEQKTAFRLLDRVGAGAGRGRWPQTLELADRIADAEHEGGWVIVGALLWQHYAGRPADVVSSCRQYIIAADVWYGADILAERVPGPALVQDFVTAADLLASWRTDSNRWVRRALGVAVHFWAKRSRGDQALKDRAELLLDFLAPMFEEWNIDAVKGVGWGLKTLGRHYPDRVAEWLLLQYGRPCRRLILRKALTYLPAEDRLLLLKEFGL